ncbi:helix-turn-helix transcriptional regulator [Streptomyces sp. NPDC003943]
MDEGRETVPGAGELSLSDEDLKLYSEVLKESVDVSADDPRLENLRSIGVVFNEPLSNRPSARSLSQVERDFYVKELDEIRLRVQRMRQIGPILDALGQAACGSETSASTNVVQVLRDKRAINAVIHNAIEHSGIVWSSQTRPRALERLAKSADRDVVLLERGGVRYRTLYPTSARTRPAETEYARRTAETGHAESRTSSRNFSRMILTDTVALISDIRVGEGAGEPAITIRDPGLLAWLRELYQREWEAADPWFPAPANGSTDRELIERDILEMLSEGRTRESICRTLEISPRTYTNYMAALRDRYDARTNEQLMYRIGCQRAVGASE